VQGGVMDKKLSFWSALLNFFFSKVDMTPVQEGTLPRQPREHQVDMQCCICKSVESFDVLEDIDREGHINWGRTYLRAERRAFEKDWKELWVVGGKKVCPGCVAQMKWAIVPGQGIELVPEAMVKEGRAFLVSDFKAQEHEGDDGHKEKLNEN